MTDKKAEEKACCAAKKFRQEQAWLGKVSKQSSEVNDFKDIFTAKTKARTAM